VLRRTLTLARVTPPVEVDICTKPATTPFRKQGCDAAENDIMALSWPSRG
jgi:hypothetical protein